MTLDDLRDLCARYVPEASRHPNSLDGVALWWNAHEIGHLLTVERWDDRGRVCRILRRLSCLRLPHTREGLERKIQRAVAP